MVNMENEKDTKPYKCLHKMHRFGYDFKGRLILILSNYRESKIT